jgi:hypothetical protein
MLPYQERVVSERVGLDANLSRLRMFLKTKTFAVLPEAERKRLVQQAAIMADYSDVLGERIEAFA